MASLNNNHLQRGENDLKLAKSAGRPFFGRYKNNLKKRPIILPLRSALLIFVPLAVIILSIVVWTIQAHQRAMVDLITEKNRSIGLVSSALLEAGSDDLSTMDRSAQGAYIAELLEPAIAGRSQISTIIINEEREVLFSSAPLHVDSHLPDHPGVSEALLGQEGEVRTRFSDGTHVTLYQPIESLGWAYVQEEIWAEGPTSLLNLTLLIPLLFLPLVLAAIILLWLTELSIIKPLRLVASQAKEYGEGGVDMTQLITSSAGAKEIVVLQNELFDMATKLSVAQAKLREYANGVQTARERERFRLSQELHDDTIQSLIHLDQRIQLLDLGLPGEAKTADFCQQIEDLRGQNGRILQNIRHIIQDLRPTYLDELGLVAALEILTEQLGVGRSEKIHFAVLGPRSRLADDVELAFYRIAQEGITNALKHANGAEINIQLTFLSDHVGLQIEDDGAGFAKPDSTQLPGQYGLMGMHERAKAVGGELMIESGQSGTLIRLEVPLKSDVPA